MKLIKKILHFLFIYPLTRRTLVLFAMIGVFYACNKNNNQAQPQPAPVPAPSPPPAPSPAASVYSLSYTDGTTAVTFTESIGHESAILMEPLYESGNIWYSQGSGFYWGTTSDHVNFEVSLPIDSSRMSLLTVGKRYLITDSSITLMQYLPGSASFIQSKSTGTDKTQNELDTLTNFNKITSLTYVGNRRYEQWTQTMICDYEVKGQFNLRVKHDLSGTVRTIRNGSYYFKFAVFAK